MDCFRCQQFSRHWSKPVKTLWASRWKLVFRFLLPRQSGEAAEFCFLQIRPLTLSRDHQDLSFDNVEPRQLLCESNKVLGNGRIENLYDVVVIDSQRFERSRSQEVAKAVAHFNAVLHRENRPHLL